MQGSFKNVNMVRWRLIHTLQHTARHCITLQHTATHCNTLQRTATHCNKPLHTAAHCSTPQHKTNALLHATTHCNTAFDLYTALRPVGGLRLVGSAKWHVFFVKEPYFFRSLFQMRRIVSSLLIVHHMFKRAV